MKSVVRLVWLLACGCGGLDGLSVFAPMIPQAVGTSAPLSVSRCIHRNVIYDCTEHDSFASVAIAFDNGNFTLGGNSFTLEDGKFVFRDVRTAEGELIAVAPGSTRLTITATSQSGGALTEQRTLEARELAQHDFACSPYPCLDGLGRLPHQKLAVHTHLAVDAAGAKVGGEADYQVTGSLDPAGPLRLDVGAGQSTFITTVPGEGRVEPVDERLRAVTKALVVQVAAPDDAEALFFARALDDGHGRLMQPLVTADFDVVLGTRFSTNEPFARLDVWPVISLRDGGWAAVDPDELRRERPDGGSVSACLSGPPCVLDFHQAGEATWFVDAGSRTLRATFTAH